MRERMKKRICIITHRFPTPKVPVQFVFVDEIVTQFADFGYDIDVICPVAVGKEKERGYMGNRWCKKTNKGNLITVYQPRMISFSTGKKCGIDFDWLSTMSFHRTVIKQFRKLMRPDYIYAHFLYSGMVAARLSELYGVPAFCACGESDPRASLAGMPSECVKSYLNKLTGVVSVSNDNKKFLLDCKLVNDESIIVLPNAVDQSVFYPHDKSFARKELGFPDDVNIGIFSGGFNERKGVMRVQQAVKGLDKLYMIYAGSGAQQPTGDNVLYSGVIEHHKLPLYLSAADFFILPTQAEGCCNAIVEAMACGLPVISSSGTFNDDILDESNSIRVPANDVEGLKHAVEEIIENKNRRSMMSEASLAKSRPLNLPQRASSILRFMGEEI